MSSGDTTAVVKSGSRRLEQDSPNEHQGERAAALDRYVWLAARTTRATMALISVIEEQRQVFKSTFGLPEAWDGRQDLPLAHSPCRHAIASGMPVVVDDAPHHPLLRENTVLGELRARAYAGVPLCSSHGQVFGTLSVFDTRPRAWEPDDVQALREIAALVVMHIELQSRAGGRELPVPAGSTLFRSDCMTPLPPDEHPFSRALRGETVTQAEYFVRVPEHPEGRWHRINATPLRDAQGAVRGAIVVGSDVTEQRMTQERLSQTVEALRLLALLDELTGLHNRRGFLTLAEHQIKHADQTGQPLLMFFADLDDLKRINDTFGHEAGDQALRDAGRLLRATFRETDLLARLGGDEFVVLAADASINDADLFAARLQAALRAYNAMAERRFVLSISTGATAYDPRAPEPLESLLKRADAAMYRVKRMRRSSDRVPR